MRTRKKGKKMKQDLNRGVMRSKRREVIMSEGRKRDGREEKEE